MIQQSISSTTRPFSSTGLALPNVFMLGAAKCGTTTLASWLDKHPACCVSNPKEPLFFNRAKEYVLGADAYSKLHYAHYSGEPYVIDCRPQTMMLGFAPARIRATVGEPAGFILCVRDPIARAFSDWHNYYRMRPGRERSFSKAINANLLDINVQWADFEGDYEMQLDFKGGNYRPTYIESGMYYTQMIKFSAEFPDTPIKFMIVEDMMRNPSGYWRDICEFMNMEPIEIEFMPKNVAMMTTFADMKADYPETTRALMRVFRDDVYALGNLIGRDLEKIWWRD